MTSHTNAWRDVTASWLNSVYIITRVQCAPKNLSETRKRYFENFELCTMWLKRYGQGGLHPLRGEKEYSLFRHTDHVLWLIRPIGVAFGTSNCNFDPTTSLILVMSAAFVPRVSTCWDIYQLDALRGRDDNDDTILHRINIMSLNYCLRKTWREKLSVGRSRGALCGIKIERTKLPFDDAINRVLKCFIRHQSRFNLIWRRKKPRVTVYTSSCPIVR